MTCRICLCEGDLLPLGCKCTGAKVHFDCAFEWYKHRVTLVMSGKLTEKTWTAKTTCSCEICNHQICEELRINIVNEQSPGTLKR